MYVQIVILHRYSSWNMLEVAHRLWLILVHRWKFHHFVLLNEVQRICVHLELLKSWNDLWSNLNVSAKHLAYLRKSLIFLLVFLWFYDRNLHYPSVIMLMLSIFFLLLEFRVYQIYLWFLVAHLLVLWHIKYYLDLV